MQHEIIQRGCYAIHPVQQWLYEGTEFKGERGGGTSHLASAALIDSRLNSGWAVGQGWVTWSKKRQGRRREGRRERHKRGKEAGHYSFSTFFLHWFIQQKEEHLEKGCSCISGWEVCESVSEVCEMEGYRGEHEQIERPETLNEEERVTIKNTWAKVYENKQAAGVAVLIRYSSLSICLSLSLFLCLHMALSLVSFSLSLLFYFRSVFSCLTGWI